MVASTLRARLGFFRRSSFQFAVPVLMVSGLACSSTDGPGGGGTSGSSGVTAGASGSISSTGGNPSVAGSTSVGTSGGPSGGGASSGGASGGGGSNAVGGTLGMGGGSAGSGGNTNPAGGAAGGGNSDPVNASALVKAMGFGTNIGNTLENTSVWETGWDQPLITQAFITGLASRGIKTVRVPVAWDTYAVNGVIDAAKIDRVKQVVSWITGAGMYAIVNIHWDGGWINNEEGKEGGAAFTLTDQIKTKFANYWKQIATAFSSVDHRLILEGMNEEGSWVTDGDRYGNNTDIPAINTMNQLFVTTARAQGGYNATRALLISGHSTDIDRTCVPAFTVPTDPAGTGKLLLSIHYYTPWTFTIKENNNEQPPLSTTWGTAAETKQLEDLFTKLGTCSTEKKIPIVLGEFAVTAGTAPFVREAASRVAWMTAVAKASKTRNIVPVLWDTGLEISRADGAFSSAFQKVFDSFK